MKRERSFHTYESTGFKRRRGNYVKDPFHSHCLKLKQFEKYQKYVESLLGTEGYAAYQKASTLLSLNLNAKELHEIVHQWDTQPRIQYYCKKLILWPFKNIPLITDENEPEGDSGVLAWEFRLAREISYLFSLAYSCLREQLQIVPNREHPNT